MIKPALYLLCAISLMAGSISHAQSMGITGEELAANPAMAGGVYYAYPATEVQNSAAPKGYKPVYISHYGRHGSRYLIGDGEYRRVMEVLDRAEKAGKLTAKGVKLLEDLRPSLEESKDRWGDLSPLGVRQQNAIAHRMVEAYPEVFSGATPISARSTTVIRCALSMDAFCEGLKEANPALRITRESSQRYMDTLNYHTQQSNEYVANGLWRISLNKMRRDATDGSRLAASLFSDPEFISSLVDTDQFLWDLYWIAVGMQNIETGVDIFPLFTAGELMRLWEVVNFNNYVADSSWPGSQGLVVDNAKNLLTNIVNDADAALAGNGPGMSLRFGHDGNLIPLAAILALEGCAPVTDNPKKVFTVFANSKIAPMAGNIQMIFYRNPKKPDADILVKFLLNEREILMEKCTPVYGPYYKWEDVRNYYLNRISPSGLQ